MDKLYSQFPAPSISKPEVVTLHNFIFIGTYGKIRALQLIDGDSHTAWTQDLKGCGYHMVHLYLFNQRRHLYAATNGQIFCFDAFTGNTVWRVKPEAQSGLFSSTLMTLLCTYDGSILVSASNGALVGIDAITGQILWESRIEGFGGSRDAYALVEHKGLLFVGNEGYVYCYFMTNGQLKWKNSLKSYRYRPITLVACSFALSGEVLSDILFVGTAGYVLALEGLTGVICQSVNLDGSGYHPVALLLEPSTNILFAATYGELRCFRADTMEQLWKSSLPGLGYSYGHSLLFLDEQTIAIGINRKLAAVNKFTGQLRWSKKVGSFLGDDFVTVAATADPNVTLCASSGKLFAIDKQGTPLWKNGLKKLGYSEISVSTTVFNTDFNSTTLPQHIETRRKVRQTTQAANSS